MVRTTHLSAEVGMAERTQGCDAEDGGSAFASVIAKFPGHTLGGCAGYVCWVDGVGCVL
jgi:hypothetical protein